MTKDWVTLASEGRQQSSLTKYGEYVEDNSADDVYLEDISTYSNYYYCWRFVCCTVFLLPSLVSEIPVDHFQEYLQNTNKLKSQYQVRIILQLAY